MSSAGIRSSASMKEALQHSPAPAHTNVGDIERIGSVIGGAVLTVLGLSRHSNKGLLLALLGGGFIYRGLSGHCYTYQALGMNTADPSGPQASIAAGQGVKIEATFTINRPAQELFSFWRNFENLPRFMRHLESITVTDQMRSHWVARGPLGIRVAWDAELINEKPNEMIAWRSLENSQVNSAGSVHFRTAPGQRGTQVIVLMRYDAPGGAAASTIASLFGQSPDQLIQGDLRRFKQLMETGEIPTTAGQPMGHCC